MKVTRTYSLIRTKASNLSNITSVASSTENLIYDSVLDFVFLQWELVCFQGKEQLKSSFVHRRKPEHTIRQCYQNREQL